MKESSWRVKVENGLYNQGSEARTKVGLCNQDFGPQP